jgi:hypothetical protein
MIYDGRPLPLGSASLAIDIRTTDDHVAAIVDTEHSLLFPPHDSGPARGEGTVSAADEKMTLTIGHSIDSTVGGERNLFGRTMYRSITFVLSSAKPGVLEGTFVETISGLVVGTVTASGHVVLHSSLEPAPELADVQAPANAGFDPIRAYLSPRDVFGWAGSEGTCLDLARAGCDLLGATASSCRTDPSAHAQPLVTALAAPLMTAMSSSNAAYPAIATACRSALDATTVTGYTTSNQSCGRPVPLACMFETLWNMHDSSGTNRKLFADTVARTLAPALVLAKQDIVEAVAHSFTGGVKDERAKYVSALHHLTPTARWVLQPSVIQSLRELDATSARGGIVGDPWGAATTLADLLATLSMIDTELARASAAIESDDLKTARQRTQERALLVYLETIVITELVRVWQTVPPTIASRSSGVLGPLDNAFASLVAGNAYFGLPSAYVPFVFDPEQTSPGRTTNFGQVLARAEKDVSFAKQAEAEFNAQDRQYRIDASSLQREANALRERYDSSLRAVCGTGFVLPATSAADPDWTTCGAGESGDLAMIAARSRVAEGQVRVLASRAAGKAKQIQISTDTLQNVLHLREDEIQFRLSTGQTISAMSTAQAGLHVASHALEITANGHLWNLGIPTALAAVAVVLDTIGVVLESSKDQLKLAIEAKTGYAGIEEVKLRGVEQLQREWIEFEQLQLEVQEGAKALAVNAIEARNLLDRARLVFEDRRRALVLLASDPARDPSVRVLRENAAVAAVAARSQAQRQLWLASRALSFEINTNLPTTAGAALRASNGLALDGVAQCLQNIHDGYVQSFGVPQEYTTELSLRRLLGATSAQQFTELLKSHTTKDGSIELQFATTLQQPTNGATSSFFSSTLCNDKLWTIAAKIEGDFLGDNRAEIDLALRGANFMRTCLGDEVLGWSIGTAPESATAVAVIQAGVSTWGDARANSSFAARAVAQAQWTLTIPSGTLSPDNADLFEHIENVADIWLRVTHRAQPRRTTSASFSTACLGQ